MNKSELEDALAKSEERVAELDDLLVKSDTRVEKALKKVKKLQGDLKGAKSEAGEDLGGLLPMVLHVGGVEWNGTACSLVRCATGGELASKWLVRRGSSMYTTSGHKIPYVPYAQVPKALQSKVGWELTEAIEFLSK